MDWLVKELISKFGASKTAEDKPKRKKKLDMINHYISSHCESFIISFIFRYLEIYLRNLRGIKKKPLVDNLDIYEAGPTFSKFGKK